VGSEPQAINNRIVKQETKEISVITTKATEAIISAAHIAKIKIIISGFRTTTIKVTGVTSVMMGVMATLVTKETKAITISGTMGISEDQETLVTREIQETQEILVALEDLDTQEVRDTREARVTQVGSDTQEIQEDQEILAALEDLDTQEDPDNQAAQETLAVLEVLREDHGVLEISETLIPRETWEILGGTKQDP